MDGDCNPVNLGVIIIFIFLLMCADDMVLVSETDEGLREMFNKLIS